MKYAFIERHKKIWPIVIQCRVLEVSASGFAMLHTPVGAAELRRKLAQLMQGNGSPSLG